MYSIIIATLAVSVLGDGIYHVKNSVPANVIYTAPAQKQNNKPKHVSMQIINKPSSISKAFKDVAVKIVEDKNPNKVALSIFDDKIARKPSKKIPTAPITIVGFPSASPSPSPIPAPTPEQSSPKPLKENSPEFKPIQAIEDDSIDEVAGSSLPSAIDEECLSIADTIVQNPKLATLQAAVEATQLTQFLSDSSLEATLFAPSNNAFKKLAKSLNMSIQQVLSNPALASVVGYHLVPGVALSAFELKSDEKLATSIKQNVTVGLPPSGEITITGFEASNIAKINTADISACKSIVHIIDTVLLPDESVDETV